ncbi:MAG: ATP-binding cassette domain-containing protein [Anaerotruncus massiliensis (ex Togo et al. 2019)]
MREPVEEPDPAHAADLVRDGHAFYWQRYRDDGAPAERVPVRGDVRFEDVTFGYAPEKTVLRHISLYAKPGQKIAFVGSTGAEQTTVTNLLTRFYDIAEGRITIDGIDIRQIKKDSLRRSLAMVLQDTTSSPGPCGTASATDAPTPPTRRSNRPRGSRQHSSSCACPRLRHGDRGDGANLSQGQRQLPQACARRLPTRPSSSSTRRPARSTRT